MWTLDGEKIKEIQPGDALPNILVSFPAHRQQALAQAAMDVPWEFGKGGTRFEAHSGYDAFSVTLPDFEQPDNPSAHVEGFFTGEKLLVFCDNHGLLHRFLAEAQSKACQRPDMLLFILYSCVMTDDTQRLEALEEDIEDLEEKVMVKRPDDVSPQIFGFRKRLLVLKKYYESLFDLLEDLEENRNGFLAEDAQRLFRLHTNRAGRLVSNVMTLRDYVTQVREAYQGQIDISQNNTMQIFTVLTAIFLPLTLIAGWYGMNFIMPEYELRYAYPVVLAVSISVVLFCLWYFKKNKWF